MLCALRSLWMDDGFGQPLLATDSVDNMRYCYVQMKKK